MCCARIPSNVVVVTKSQLHERVYGPEGYFSAMFTGIYYVGTDRGYHVFAFKYGNIKTQFVKVAASEFVIDEPMRVTDSESEWIFYIDKFPLPAGGK
jgi:hypothetical protein